MDYNNPLLAHNDLLLDYDNLLLDYDKPRDYQSDCLHKMIGLTNESNSFIMHLSK